MKRHLAYAALALTTAFAGTPAQAQFFEDLDAVEYQVAAFLGVSPAAAGSAFMPVDRRLRLSACPAPLAISWYGTRQQSVLVQCPQPGGWKIYVRTMGNSMAPVAMPVIKRGDAVTVTLRGPGFSISQSAEALEQGAVGEWVRIRVGKDSEMRAEVLRPGTVGMNLP